MREPKKRIIYDNYDTESYEEEAKETLVLNDIEDHTEVQLWEMVGELIWDDWNVEYDRLEAYLNQFPGIICFGTIGLWNGTRKAWNVFDNYLDLVRALYKDCDYRKIWDENGHLYLQGCHHDGTNEMEVKVLTEQGKDYYDRWNYGVDERKGSDVIDRIIKNSKYSHLPRYAERQYGCKRYEYEKEATR